MIDLVDELKELNERFEIEFLSGQIETFEYMYNDPIFTLASPNEHTTGEQNPFCNCCKEPYKSVKDTKYCQFCALAYCKDCRYKSKEFPACNDSEKLRGEVCKVCDRKFHIRHMLKERNLQIEAQTQQLLGRGGMAK